MELLRACQAVDFKSKKGSTMVEAAVVFPIVILAVMAVIYILIAMYGNVVTQAQIHTSLRKEVGIITKNENVTLNYIFDNGINTSFNSELNINRHVKIGFDKINVDLEKKYSGKGLLNIIVNRNYFDFSYVVNQEDFIRKINLISKGG